MTKKVLIRKITSRKFLGMVTGATISFMVAFNSNDPQVKVEMFRSGVGIIVSYILAEAYVDGKRKNTEELEE